MSPKPLGMTPPECSVFAHLKEHTRLSFVKGIFVILASFMQDSI